VARTRCPGLLAPVLVLVAAAGVLGVACSAETGGERPVPSTVPLTTAGASASSTQAATAGEVPSTADETQMRRVLLPPPRIDGDLSLEQAIAGRRSERDYADEPLSLSDVGQLLWAAQGITGAEGVGRAAPSAGGLYPLEVRVVAERVEGLSPGAYHYAPDRHELALTGGGSRREALAEAGLSQEALARAPAVLVVSGVFARTTAKYGERGVGYVFMEAGHAAENVYLQAVALGLGTVSIGAFDDAAVAQAVGLSAEEQPLYLMPVGRLDALP
jgi:SagB-type dehydrogenase family enzyme